MPRALGGAIGASRQRENRGRSDTNGSGWLDSYDEWPDGNIFYIPLRFRKAGRGWCGGARDTH